MKYHYIVLYEIQLYCIYGINTIILYCIKDQYSVLYQMQLYNCFDAHIHCSISRLIKQRNRTEAIVLRQITNACTITTQHIRLAEQQLPGNQSAALSSHINRQ